MKSNRLPNGDIEFYFSYTTRKVVVKMGELVKFHLKELDLNKSENKVWPLTCLIELYSLKIMRKHCDKDLSRYPFRRLKRNGNYSPPVGRNKGAI